MADDVSTQEQDGGDVTPIIDADAFVDQLREARGAVPKGETAADDAESDDAAGDDEVDAGADDVETDDESAEGDETETDGDDETAVGDQPADEPERQVSKKRAKADLETRLGVEVKKNTDLEEANRKLQADLEAARATAAAAERQERHATDLKTQAAHALAEARAKDPEPDENRIGEDGQPANMDEYLKVHSRWAGRDAIRLDKHDTVVAEAEKKAAEVVASEAQRRTAFITERQRFETETRDVIAAWKKTPEGKDLDAILATSTSVISGHMEDAIYLLPKEDRGPVFKALASNPAESKRIAELPGAYAQQAAIVEMARRMTTAQPGSASSGSRPDTRPRVPVVRPHQGRASASVPLAQETNADKYVDRLRAKSAAASRVGRRR